MATGASKSRVRDLVEQGAQLFGKRAQVMSLWQEIALNFYPERADFTTSLPSDGDYAAHLMTGMPPLCRRDLANTLSAMLRPRDKPWFRARTHSDTVNEDAGAKAFLDKISERMRKLMYAKRSQFVRATKQGDNDFASFGQAVISLDPLRDMSGLLYRSWHLRDVAWCENAELQIEAVHRNWCLGARALRELFKGKVAANVAAAAEKAPYTDVKCRHIVLPADHYDYTPDPAAPRTARRLPYVSIYVDVENDFILEEKPVKRINYVIPRWATVAGSQYAHSPATVIALPDARLLQQITLTLLEAGQKVVDPPALASKEAIQGPLQLFAGGATWVDTEYDERTGEALRYLQIDPSGLNWGGEREKIVSEQIRAALFLDQISIPYPEGEKWTATEYRGRVEQYVMRALPLFEPMEVEYNGGLCEETFELIRDMNGFGTLFADMPDILSGQDIRWTFESPLQEATERAKSQAFLQCSELLKVAAEMATLRQRDFDVTKSLRDAIAGTGAPADWVVPQEQADKARAADAKAAQMQEQMAAAAQLADVVQRGGQAADAAGLGAESLRAHGLV
ncbi:MAG: hypothetical protein IT481_08555 [Gammaproteobacteria bacterium]|nr:hypothetical protein [Gammaproteobacteria bacterium]